MNENDVRRVLSEKKEGFNVEAGGILHKRCSICAHH